jgi:hypothetical protein
VENLARTEDECGRWPIDVDELGVPMMDAAAVGRSAGESISSVRSDYFLLNNDSA